MTPKAVLFDFDGVIADTENHHIAAWQRTLSVMGWLIADELAVRAAEVDDREFLTDLFTTRDVPVDRIDDWLARKQAVTVQLLRYSPRVYPGVVELVEALRGRKARLAVVTGTWRANVQAVLEASGLAGAFDVIVAKEDVTAQKPDPAPYLLALKKLRLAPRSAVAIEDSPTGLASAGAAGIRRIAVGHRRPPGEWAEDATFVESLEPAAELLERLGF
ncbi:MAG: HAD family hydrolase [Isosphaeraceae bacterium]